MLQADPRWQAVLRVVASPTFSKASRLSAFLLYVCDRALRGLENEITEQQVGVHVFGRPADYNPGDDNIVRGSARQLRQRLAVYYQEEGADDTIRVQVPRGGYVPVFEDQSPAVPAKTVSVKRQWLPAVAASVALVALMLLMGSGRRPASDPLWSALFSRNLDTFLVPGDSGVVMYQNLTGRTVHISDYAGGNYRADSDSSKVADPGTLESIASRRYTSISDLRFATRLVRLPQVVPDRLQIRYARDLRIEDLKDANAIVVGAPQGNPWVEVFDHDMNFHIDSDEKSRTLTVVNRAPLRGEQAAYVYSPDDPGHRAYAMVAFTANLNRTGRVLIIEGTTMAGIDAGADFLFSDALLGPVLEEARGPDGSLRRFELVIETSHITNNASSVKVVARRFRPF